MNTDTMIISGVACVCAFLALVAAGGLGFFLMKKKSADAPDADGSDDGVIRDEEGADIPASPTTFGGEKDVDHAGVVIPVSGASSDSAPAEPDPPTEKAAAIPDPSAAPVEPIEEAPVEEAPVEEEPAITQDPVQEEPDPPRTTSILDENVPDPSSIRGLDPTPIIASDTLDEDEAESPTVIIPRGMDPDEDA